MRLQRHCWALYRERYVVIRSRRRLQGVYGANGVSDPRTLYRRNGPFDKTSCTSLLEYRYPAHVQKNSSQSILFPLRLLYLTPASRKIVCIIENRRVSNSLSAFVKLSRAQSTSLYYFFLSNF